jgi:hypothetical protein
MQKALADLPVKKLAIGHWPGAVARRWIWSILFLSTFALIGYGELVPNGSYNTAALLLGFALLVAGCLYFAGFEDRHYIYSLALIDGNILRYSTIWKMRDVSLRDIEFLKLYTTSPYARIIHRGGSLATYSLTDAEYKVLLQLFSAIVAAEPHIELEMINRPYEPPRYYIGSE